MVTVSLLILRGAPLFGPSLHINKPPNLNLYFQALSPKNGFHWKLAKIDTFKNDDLLNHKRMTTDGDSKVISKFSHPSSSWTGLSIFMDLMWTHSIHEFDITKLYLKCEYQNMLEAKWLKCLYKVANRVPHA